MPPSASHTESRSSRGPNQKQWLPVLVLAALFSLSVASTVGLSMAAVTFSRTDALMKPGHGIAQCFVMFASLLSLFYIPLHILAARKGASLYPVPLIPSFRHQLHAWATIIIRLAAAMWASASVTVAVGIYQGGGGSNTIHLNAGMFACSTGFLSTCVVLCTVQLAAHPFTLPWISPANPDEEIPGDFDDKTSSITRGSSSTDRTLGGSPVQPQSKTSSRKTSRSTSTNRSRTRTMARTRRYILDAPTPVTPVSPLKRHDSNGTDGPPASGGEGGKTGDLAKFERGLVPSASESESFFAAAAGTAADSPDGQKGKGAERSATPETVVYVGLPRVPGKAAVGGSDAVGRRAPVERPLGPRDMRSGGGQGGGLEVSGAGSTPLPPPPSPSPVQAYTVPGAWVPHVHSDPGTVGYF